MATSRNSGPGAPRPPSSHEVISTIDLTEDVELDDIHTADPNSYALEVDVDAPIPEEAYSVDNLLALTGDEENWDIDAHARSLKQAAGPRRSSTSVARSTPSLALPTPIDLGGRPRTSLPAPPPSDGGSPLPPGVRPPEPPARSRPPPPMPADGRGRKVDSKRPPPLRPLTEGSPTRFTQITSTDAVGLAALAELIAARIAYLESADDAVGLARAHIEHAVTSELQGDDARVNAHLEAALKVDPDLAIAHAILRRRMHGHKSLGGMLAHLDIEIRAATIDASAVGLLSEKARLLDAQGEEGKAVRAAWELVLAKSPNQPAGLKGLESELARAAATPNGGRAAQEEYARHLAVMADAYASQPELGAWIHVERARILERDLRRPDEARGALERAVLLDPSVGPVRNAYNEFLSSHDDAGTLAAMLDDEAQLETRPGRSARLELEAAIIAAHKLRDDARAIALLERAAARAPTQPNVDRRVIEELIMLYERGGHQQEAVRARRARIGFLTEPSQLGYELRRLAALSEKLGDLDSAAQDLASARELTPDDTLLLENLDRILALLERHGARKTLWVEEAERAQNPKAVAKHLCRAARLAELMDERDDALRHLESARLVAPADAEAVDELARLLTPAPSERADGESRRLIELYTLAVPKAQDPARKVAYLEKIALLWEDIIGDARRASKSYDEILTLDPGRRSAILGLLRTATKVNDARGIARALLEEARLDASGEESLDLRIRAATALAPIDPSRALSIVTEVLSKDAAHPEARALETRLHEDAGRWELTAQSLRARIDHAHSRGEKVKLWLALAQVQDTSLHAHEDALASLKSARALDPHHLVPPAEVARILTEHGTDATLRLAFEGLAQSAATADERALYLIRAAEVEEFKSGDDSAAARLYVQALVETPHDELLADRLARVLARRSKQAQDKDPTRRGSAGLGERITLLSKRHERATDRAQKSLFAFELAELLIELGQDLPKAITLLEQVQQESPQHVPALRTLEAIHLRASGWSHLARVLSLQGDNFVDARARLGSLWTLAAIEEWKLSNQGVSDSYERILELDPTDPGALEAILRSRFAEARNGDVGAINAVITALRAFTTYAADDSTRLLAEVQLALVLETWGEGRGDAVLREALERYAVGLSIDPTSVAATTGLARLANRLGDLPSAVDAAHSLAELSKQKPKVRARYLLDAATLLLSEHADDRMGTPRIRSEKAVSDLEEALDVDPDSIPVASALASLRQERGEHAKLVDSLRSAILKATSPDAIVMIGTEIATVARDEQQDLPVAIEAMKKVREAAPTHTPSLLTLSELYIASRAWDLATETLETVAKTSPDTQARLTALFALARIYEKITKALEDAERVLRSAVECDPRGPRAIRALLHRLASKQTEPRTGSAPLPDHREEIADLLQRLADVERDRVTKAGVLLQLAEVRQELGHLGPAERALVEAVAHAPENGVALTRLGRFFRADPTSHARALTQVIGRGRELGAADARWFALLGHIEIEKLGRVRDGVAHLRQAIHMDAKLFESRFELGSALARMGSNDEASRVLLDMVSPDPRPVLAIADPASALDLLERTLNAERRPEEAIVVSELRAIAGDLDDGRQAWLRARRLSPLETHHAPFDRGTLLAHVVPRVVSHPLLDVAHAVFGMEAKILRADLTDLGISTRDRVGRGHPVRVLLDRIARAAQVSDVELVISPSVNRTRVLVQDEPWIVMPRKLTELPEPTQLATLARAVAKIALSVPWLEELPPPHIEAYLVACARQVVPHYGAEDVDVLSQRLVLQYEPTVAKVLSRKQRKNLEELAPRLATPEARPIPIDTLTGGLAQGELRIAYLLTGDLLATIDELRGLDANFLKQTDTPGRAALASVLTHGYAGDVCRFALTTEATALRRRVGATWAG